MNEATSPSAVPTLVERAWADAPGPLLVAMARVRPAEIAALLAGEMPTTAVPLAGEVMEALLATPWAGRPESLDALLTLAGALRERVAPRHLARVAQLALRDGRVEVARGLVLPLLGHGADEPAVLRVAVDLAVADGRGRDAHALLTRLVEADRSAAAVRAAYRRRETIPEDGAPAIRAAFLSSFTVDPIVAWFDHEVRRIGLRAEIFVGPFNAIAQQVLDPASALYAARPEIVFLAPALDDLVPELAAGIPADELGAVADRVLGEVVGHVRSLAERSDAFVVVHALTSVYIGRGLVDTSSAGLATWQHALNGRLAEALAAFPRCRVLDVAAVVAARTGGRFDDPKMRHLAGMRFSDEASAALAEHYVRYVVAVKGLTRKCLVLDLDNTLWGGIVGEDGPDGIHLGLTSPGAEYREFQQGVAALARRGILLAVNSKNNPDDALGVIRTHPGMALREADFSAVRINWQSKVENLRAIAAELNIGIDSLVFMDDNPVECEQVRQMLPEVVTVQMPRDPARYRETLDRLPWFDVLAVTAEDLDRSAQYRAKRDRDVLKDRAPTVEEYLASLDIRVTIAPLAPATLQRAVQLLARTNQFNLTTRRHGAAELGRWMSDERWRIDLLRARDRFGDHGIVAMAIAEREDTTWRIDSLLMSCRVIGQGIETALLAHLHETALAAGATALAGEFRPTAKNAQVRDFYERHGFALADEDADGAKRSMLVLPANLAWPVWIAREDA